MKNEIVEFKLGLNGLKEKMLKLLKMCDKTDFKQEEAYDTLKSGLVNLLQIKGCNSAVQKEVEVFKEDLNKEKESLEKMNLNYQNHLYQNENIISQINNCIHYPTSQLNRICLASDDEVAKFYLDKGILKNSIDQKDKLEYELEKRTEFSEKLTSLVSEKDEKFSLLKVKEKFFEGLPRYFSKLDTSTVKAQKFLKLNITEHNENSILSEKLPPALYVLYNSFLYSEIANMKMKVQIEGRVDLIDEFNEKNNKFGFVDEFGQDSVEMGLNNKEEGEHSDDGEVNEESTIHKEKKPYKLKFRNKMKDSSINKIISKCLKPDLIQRFPLSVTICINKVDNLESDVKIEFFYLSNLDIVSVNVQSSKVYLNADSLLSNLFMPPSALNSNLRSKIHSYLSCNLTKGERFYDYIQILCNNVNYDLSKLVHPLDFKSHLKGEAEYKDDPNKITTQLFIKRLSERIKSIPNLVENLEYLRKYKKFQPEVTSILNNEKRFKAVKEKTQISDFFQIPQSEYLKAFNDKFMTDNDYNISDIDNHYTYSFERKENGDFYRKIIKSPITFYSETEALYYKITFERKIGGEAYKIFCYLEIGFEYPRDNPKFILSSQLTNNYKNLIPENLLSLVCEESLDFYQQYSKVKVNNQIEMSLREIEKEVNVYYDDICSDSKLEYLIFYTIRNIQMCLDVLFDIESGKENVLFKSLSKGKEKKRPFNFNNNYFEAR